MIPKPKWPFSQWVAWCCILILGLTMLTSAAFGSSGDKVPAVTKVDTEVETLDVESQNGVIKRGSAIGDSPAVDLAKVVEDPSGVGEEPVTLTAQVADVCQKKGCWMTVVADDSEVAIRVTFKDYGFFVPKDSKGMLVRAEGVFETRALSKEEADHLEAEGANLNRNADGTATELGFVATGVELTRSENTVKPPKAAAETDGGAPQD